MEVLVIDKEEKVKADKMQKENANIITDDASQRNKTRLFALEQGRPVAWTCLRCMKTILQTGASVTYFNESFLFSKG